MTNKTIIIINLQTHETIGVLHGCNVSEQQSKLLMESLPIRSFCVP